jgi:uncharacterized surface protein with fasciclin (FAS1) repeats
MKKSVKLILAALLAVGMFGITGCVDHQERYDTPPWLGGSSIETLKERGNYNTFLELMEKANYSVPISKQLFTLFVPNDEAFAAYFKSVGKNSVADLTKDEAVQLFTLHVLRNPRSRTQLVYEYAWGEFQGPNQAAPMGEYASLFHRKPTPSTSIPYSEVVKYDTPGQKAGTELLMYTGGKNIGLFTEEFFTDFGGNPVGDDYLFMFPGSTWKKNYTPNLKAMNWHNAQVIPNPEIPDELEVRTASGFIYYLDRVVAPMKSIEEYMRANLNKYGLYYDILQRFAEYGGQKSDEQGRILYRKSYTAPLFNLAEELGPSTNTAVPPQNMWTIFLPPNDVLQKYLDDTVLKYYDSLDSVPRVTLYYILQTQLSARLVVMSALEKGYFNAFGDAMNIPKSDIASGYMCSNGVVYESKKVLEPNVFTCVPGLLFIDKDYSTLLYALNAANMLSSLSNPDSHVTLFASTNEQLEKYGIRYNATNAIIEFRSPANGKWNPMSSTDLNLFAQDQIYKGRLSDFSGDGTFVELTSGNYLRYANNKIAAAENQFKNDIAGVKDVIENERNGFLVKVDRPVESRLVMGDYLMSDPEVSDFAKLLTAANLLARAQYTDTREVYYNLKFLAAAKYWTGFIPTNAAMKKARDEGFINIPASPTTGWYSKLSAAGKDSVNSFIMYHFVKDDVVFDDGKLSGNLSTNRTYKNADGKTVNATVKISNIPKNLSLYDVSEQVVYLNPAKANFLVRKGVCHKLDTVLKYYKLF